ncbi:putative fused transporter subunits of ABC superfamily: ATP-binding component [Legionella geestiana]|uniref:Putative fused transporter subunits of ABC superfamily: ATP-binding component n=1 Tax=Legionella geestiana TaxID=45065 RepID=A0A0W0UA72_9GAMM|nr:ABC transporter ATP-binding protein [Legionella geestiana]KTD04409.1 putative fused transporter subunits of ABC superfamily: ATP-binding component [Legionella geestiana]QBS12939.1 ABC transporter ATP-binding protein [Legionella geestiana]QDQ39380.1 ABC transporter ATP-binding protein [Legionella geestiana]STX54561.1 ABC transporter ATP-binding protein [Legionella geestiana]
MNKQAVSLRQFLFDVIKPYKWYVGAMIFIACYWAVNNSLAPYVLKLIIDKVVAFEGNKSEVAHSVMPYVVLYIALWIGIAIDMRFLDWVRLRLFPAIRYDLTTNMFSYLGQHSHRYFQNNFAGSLSNKISDMQSAAINIFTTLDDGFAQCIGLLIAIITMLLVHPVFALVLLVWAVAFVLIAICYFKPIRDLSNRFATSKTSLVGKMVDSISNTSNVRLFARNQYENKLIQEATTDTITKDRTMQWAIIKMRIFWDISIIVLIGLNICILVNMYSKNQVSVGDFSFIISLSISIFYNLWYLASQFVNFAEELGKCKQALSIITAPLEIVDAPSATPLHITKGTIAFNQVSFHYDDGAHLFKNKNIVIEAGQKVGLVGFSGSGKSTFVNLILRLFEVESGEITIDSQNINAITQASLRENIAMIPQDISLFHRTLMENIRYGRTNASDEEVIEASQKAHCHEFISQLSEGYQALVGERGIKLSGGQRQRIAIARAMLKNAPILILDEATSALDSVTEKHIQDGLHALMQDRTTIVIAHRLSTLSEMDRILVFDNGQIIEDGKHQDLINTHGHYARLWDMQAGGFLPEKEEK